MRRSPAVLTAAVLVLAVAGCKSGSSSSGSPSGDGSTASTSSSPTSSASPTSTAADAASLVATGASASGDIKSAHLVVSSTESGKKSIFTGDVSYDPVRWQIVLTGAGSKQIEERIVGNYAYIKSPGGLNGKPWIKFNFAELEKSLGVDLKSTLNDSNPGHLLQLMEKSSDLQTVGTATVSGESTTHVAGTVDVAKVYKTLPGTLGKTYADFVKEDGLKDEHIDLWLNAQQIPLKIVESYTDSRGKNTVTVLLSKLNESVSVSAPPASEVTTLP